MEHGSARPAPDQKRPLPPDGELAELMWRDGGVVAQAQAQHQRVFSGSNTGTSGVTGTTAAWLPDGGSGALGLGGDMYSRLWQSIAHAAGRVDGDVGAPPARSGNNGAGSSRTAGEVGSRSSFCGSNLVPAAAALHAGDDLDDAAPPPGAGASTSCGSGSSVLRKRSTDELDSRSEDGEFDAADEVPLSRRPASKRRARAAEVHNMSERRRRDRINEKMRALQELVPHCNKSDKASILDEAIEYLKSLQLQVQVMWMATGMTPTMLPSTHQFMPQMAMGLNLNSSCAPPVAQVVNQMQRVPPFMNSQLPIHMPAAAASDDAPDVSNRVTNNDVAMRRNPFLHPDDAAMVPGSFGHGPQMAQHNDILELMVGNAAPTFGLEPPSSSDGTRT